MDEKTFRKLRRRVEASSRRMGAEQEAEDITSEIVLNRLAGFGQHQTVQQSVIDSMRRNGWGARGSGVPYNVYQRSLDSGTDTEEKRSAFSSIEDERTTDPTVLSDFKLFIESLTQPHRLIACLRILWGFTESEIGYCLGVGESRICQRVAEIHKRIQAYLYPPDSGNKH